MDKQMAEVKDERVESPFSKQALRNFVATLCIGLFWLHASEFIQYKNASSLGWCAGIALTYGLCVYFSSDRTTAVLVSLLAIVALGVVNGMILRHSLAALPIMIPCALIAYLIFRWQAKQTK
jgi:hypothetical protein